MDGVDCKALNYNGGCPGPTTYWQSPFKSSCLCTSTASNGSVAQFSASFTAESNPEPSIDNQHGESTAYCVDAPGFSSFSFDTPPGTMLPSGTPVTTDNGDCTLTS